MWGKTRTQVQDRVDQVVEVAAADPFADLQPVEKLRRTTLVEHHGSVHQIVDEVAEPDPKPPSQNAKYWKTPRLGLSVARRFVAMVITLSMFAAANGGMTIAVDLLAG